MTRGGHFKPFNTIGDAAEEASFKAMKRNRSTGYINCGIRTAQALADGGSIATTDEHAPLPAVPVRDRRGNNIRLGPKALAQMAKQAMERRKAALQSESAITRERLAEVSNDIRAGITETDSLDDDNSFEFFDMPMEDYRAMMGGDAEELYKEYVHYMDVAETLHGAGAVGRRKKHTQSRSEKKKSRQSKWDQQLTVLAATFARWMHKQSVTHPDTQDIDSPPPQPASDSRYFTLDEVCGYHWIRKQWAIPHNHTQYPVQSLVAQGLISNAPDNPHWAVSIRCLQQYHQIRRVKPNISIQAFVRAMCMAQGRTASTSLFEKFSEAFDVYLSLVDRLDYELSVHMGRDAPTWRVEHFCPLCTESVEGEEELEYQFIFSADGGSSAKRWADAGRANSWRSFERDGGFRIPVADVERWKDVVKKRKVRKKNRRNDNDEEESDNDSDENEVDAELELGSSETQVIDDEEYIVKNIQGDPTDGSEDRPECTRNFKAGAADSKKGMFSCFEESGMFVAVCKHGVLILYCDMRRSGELAKYPLAIVDAIEKLHGHKHYCIGYDIWCTFCKTVQKAGLELNADGTTLAMHGYAHGRLCQLKDLPLYRMTLGLADCEQCERWFSAANNFAGVTRHASSFHRHQAIKMHTQQSNAEKEENFGKYIYQNYKQALELVDTLLPILTTANRERGLKPEDFLRMHREELAYLEALKKEPDEESLKCTYIETLHKLWEAQELERQRLASRGTATAATNTRAKNKRRSPISLSAIMAETEQYLERCAELESQLEIDVRWTTETAEYVVAKAYNDERQYRVAAMEVKMLVTQRFMEMAKCHMQGTNYKVRTNIAKHLQSRSKAIRNSVARLNRFGRAIGKPNIPIKDVLKEQFLEDFHLMEALGDDVRTKDWAKRDLRVLRDQFFKLRCAQTEIKILHVEIRRVEKWMNNESEAFANVMRRLKQQDNDVLASYAENARREFLRKCTTIRHWLSKLGSLRGYVAPTSGHTSPQSTNNGAENDGEASGEEEEDEENEVADTMDEMHAVLVSMERHG